MTGFLLLCQPATAGIVLEFPKQSVGELYTCDPGELTKRKNLGSAQGTVSLPAKDKFLLKLNARVIENPSLLNFPSIRQVGKLSLVHTNINDSWIDNITSLKQLEGIEFDDAPITDKAIPRLAEFSQLKILGLRRSKITGSNLSLLKSSKLQVLDLGLNRLESQALHELSALRRLRSLSVSNCAISWIKTKDLRDRAMADKLCAEPFAELGKLTQLETLTLSGLPLGPESYGFLSKLGNLTHLRVGATNIDTASIKLLEAPHLILLNLNQCPAITDETIRSLNRFTSLNRLGLRATNVTGAGASLLDLPRIQQLDLGNTNLAGHDLKGLSKLVSLQMLNLGGTGIDDSAIKNLARLSLLHELILSDTKATGASIQALAKLKSLRILDLSGTEISEKDYAQLKQSLPQCKIIWKPW